VNGTSTLNGPVSINNTLNVTGLLSANAGLSVSSISNFLGQIQLNGNQGISGYVLTSGGGGLPFWGIPSGTTLNPLTVNGNGSGNTNFSFNGTTAYTLSYNSVGAPSVGGTGAVGTWAINISGNATTATTAVTAITANNISGGSAGVVPYQSAPNTTAFTAVGTAGYLLTSNGTGAPTWTAPPTSFTSITEIIVPFTTPGTTGWIVPAGVRSLKIIATAGGGGGGGGYNYAVYYYYGGQGGGGGETRIWSDTVVPGNNFTLNIGQGGIGGGVNNNGTSGGATIIKNNNITILTCNPGGGGYSAGNILNGGNGGSGGSFDIPGQNGVAFFDFTITDFFNNVNNIRENGAGGSSYWGSGTVFNNNGPLPNIYGCGGGGGAPTNTVYYSGNNGGNGVVVISYFALA
jgi:hypothetical protein